MPEHTEQCRLALTPDQALAAAQAAAHQLVSESGWNVKETHADGLVIGEPASSLLGSTWPVTIRIGVAADEDDPGQSSITLHGSNMGWGPIQSNAVRSRVQNLRFRIAALAGDPSALQAQPASPAGEAKGGPSLLERLGSALEAASSKQTAAKTKSQTGSATAPAPDAAPDSASKDRIFISYRRSDSADVTGRLYDRLIARFGKAAIFKDVDSIPLGVDFRDHLQNVVGQCHVVLAVVGKDWLNVTSEDGRRRLDDPGDYVRIEIEGALKRSIPVVPLLVRGASMPQEDDLPESLRPFAFRNGTPIRSDPDFHNDVDRLITGLQDHLAASGQ